MPAGYFHRVVVSAQRFLEVSPLSEARHASQFAFLSGIGWLIDTTVLEILVAAGSSTFLAGFAGALAGAAFAFLTARRWVFDNRENGYLVKLMVYLSYALILAYLIGIGVHAIAAALDHLAVLFGTAISATILAFAAKVLITPGTLLVNYFVARRMLKITGR